MKPTSPARCSGGLSRSERCRLLDPALESEAAWVQRRSQVVCTLLSGTASWPAAVHLPPHSLRSGLVVLFLLWNAKPRALLLHPQVVGGNVQTTLLRGHRQLEEPLPLVSFPQKGVEGGPRCSL